MLSTIVTALALGGACRAHGDHGDHGQKPIVDEHANWMTRHMAGKQIRGGEGGRVACADTMGGGG